MEHGTALWIYFAFSCFIVKSALSAYGVFSKAAVVSSNGICSDIGKNVLKNGGNAVDAIIATAICIGATEPQSSGLGGGHFLTVYNKTTKSCAVFDARERAPLNSKEDMFMKNPSSAKYGWKALAVPGEVHGFWSAYKNVGGKVPWKSLWQPTIELCERNLKVSPSLAKALLEEKNSLEKLPDFDIFKNPWTKEFLATNDSMLRLKLAETMEKLANAEDPVQFFYNSSFTELFVNEIRANDGIINVEDMNTYRTKHGQLERPPIYANLQNGLTLCGPPPPSSAAVTTAILNILDGYNVATADAKTMENSLLIFHRLAEAMKFAYGIRYQLADMDFLFVARYLAESANLPSYGHFIRDRIQNRSFDDPYYYGQHTLKWDDGTSPIAVIDQYGNAASMTSSINTYFGAQVISRATGIIYNNHMDDFSTRSFSNYFNIDPSPANKIVAGKRPQSSMSPIVAYDRDSGDAVLAIGAEGGVKIISAVAQTILRILYFNETIGEAIEAPRLHNQLLPYATFYEKGFPEVCAKALVEGLKNIYHQPMNPNISTFDSVVCGIHRMYNGDLEAASDRRKGGGDYPSGF